MSETSRTVLVLGAYGIAGREVTRGLLEKTAARVVATGRREEKLAALERRLAHDRLEVRPLDVEDGPALAAAAAAADLVVNCVGPYSMGGAEVARRVLDAGCSYVDCATEQAHFHRLRELDGRAREAGLLLLTATGQTPGLSTFLLLHAASRIRAPRRLVMTCAQGRLPDEEAGFGSVMGALLEPGLRAESFREGRLTPEPLGHDRAVEHLPEPFGQVTTLGVPNLDALLVPPRVPGLRSLHTRFFVGVEPPLGTFAFLRWLRPHRFPLAYRLLSGMTRAVMRRDHRRAVSRGLDTSGFMRFTATGGGERWGALVPFPDGGTVTSYLPVLFARRFLRRELEARGLVTPLDLIGRAQFFGELEELGWGLEIREEPPP